MINTLDCIILIAFVVSLVIGVLKGLLKQIFAIVGFFVVIFGSASLAPYVQGWFGGVMENDNSRMLLSMILSAVILSVATALLSLVIRKILTRNKAIGALDRILGGVVSLVVAYLAVSVVIELILHTNENFLPLTKGAVGGAFAESWIVNNLYKSNFFGHFIVDGIAQKLLERLKPEIASIAQNVILNLVSRIG